MKQYDLPDQSSKNFPFTVEYGTMNGVFPEHTHTYTEIIVILNGRGVQVSPVGRCELQRGSVVTVPPPMSHRLEDMENLEVYVLKVDIGGLISFDYDLKSDPGFRSLFVQFPMTGPILDSAGMLLLKEEQLRHVISLITVMIQEYASQKSGYQMVIRSHLLALTAYLSRCFLPEQNQLTMRMRRIVSSVTYMEENLNRSIRVSELAATVYLSVRQYDRIFEQVYGMSPSAYLAELRLNRACQLMMNPEIPLGDIWQQCGFTDNSFFYRQFKRKYGMTPRQYRTQLLPSICD